MQIHAGCDGGGGQAMRERVASRWSGVLFPSLTLLHCSLSQEYEGVFLSVDISSAVLFLHF